MDLHTRQLTESLCTFTEDLYSTASSLPRQLSGKGWVHTSEQRVGNASRISTQVIAIHGHCWEAADIATGLSGVLMKSGEGCTGTIGPCRHACVSDAGSNADEHLLDSAASVCTNLQEGSRASEHSGNQTALPKVAGDGQDKMASLVQCSQAVFGPACNAAGRSLHASGQPELPAWQRWSQMQDSFSSPGATSASKQENNKQARVQSITSAIFPPLCLTEQPNSKSVRRSLLPRSPAFRADSQRKDCHVHTTSRLVLDAKKMLNENGILGSDNSSRSTKHRSREQRPSLPLQPQH